MVLPDHHSLREAGIGDCAASINGSGTTNGINGHTTNAAHSSHSRYMSISTASEFDSSNAMNGQEPAPAQKPVAICGLALRLPGKIRTPQQLWEFLLSKGDARSKVPESRYNVASFYDPSNKPASVPTEYGYFLDEDLGALDTSFFSMPRMEVEREAPEHRLMLEVARECLEDAGEMNWRGRKIGCYMGCFGEDWQNMFARDPQSWGQYRATGPGDYTLSNRVSYEFNLQGPRCVPLNLNLDGSLIFIV